MMALYMGNLMSEHSGQFIFAADSQQQPRVDIDVAPRQGERVQVRLLHDRELIRELRVVEVSDDALPQPLDITLNNVVPHQGKLRKSDQRELAADLGLSLGGPEVGRETAVKH